VAGQGWAELSGPVTVGQIPQSDGLVFAASSQGAPVRGERNPEYCADFTGDQGLAEWLRSFAVGQIPQPDGLVEACGGQGAPVGGKRQADYRASVTSQGLAEWSGVVTVG
jgi:hypothetical protein